MTLFVVQGHIWFQIDPHLRLIWTVLLQWTRYVKYEWLHKDWHVSPVQSATNKCFEFHWLFGWCSCIVLLVAVSLFVSSFKFDLKVCFGFMWSAFEWLGLWEMCGNTEVCDWSGNAASLRLETLKEDDLSFDILVIFYCTVASKRLSNCAGLV